MMLRSGAMDVTCWRVYVWIPLYNRARCVYVVTVIVESSYKLAQHPGRPLVSSQDE